MSALEQVRQVADALLYEGYLLYPYRASSQKNRSRFQFGVLMPPTYPDPSESSSLHTECLVEAKDDAEVTLLLRFLRLRRRTAEPTGGGAANWDEAVDTEITGSTLLGNLVAGEISIPFHLDATEVTEPDPNGGPDQVWRTAEVSGVLKAVALRLDGPIRVARLAVEVANLSGGTELSDREQALPQALVSAHVMITLSAGSFVSMVEPPEWAAPAVAACVNQGVWPVLAGPADCTDVMLCSPIILYDHPAIAPESPADLYDSTEIDEILTLRTMVLTDAEKAEARATDPRAAAIIDRIDTMNPAMLDKLHGAIRYLRPARGGIPDPSSLDPLDPSVPWWDPGADTSVSPETDEVLVAGVPLRRGSMVRMRPGARRADAQDFLLADRLAQVEAVIQDVDGKVHIAVTPSDDPDADIQRSHGRFLYFAPDEVEPVSS
jgi:hypothetical protein